MKLDEVAMKEIKHIALGNLVCAIVLCIIYAFLGKLTIETVLFVLGGCVVSIAGFVWLCFSIQNLLEKKPEKTKGVMTKSYLGRMVLYAAWVVISVKFGSDSFVKIAGSVPVLFPAITIKTINLINSLKNKEVKEKEDK